MIFAMFKQKTNLDIPSKLYVIRCDNKSTIDFTRSKIENTKHINTVYHIIEIEIYEKSLIELKYMVSSDNVANILTKLLFYNIINRYEVRITTIVE